VWLFNEATPEETEEVYSDSSLLERMTDLVRETGSTSPMAKSMI